MRNGFWWELKESEEILEIEGFAETHIAMIKPVAGEKERCGGNGRILATYPGVFYNNIDI